MISKDSAKNQLKIEIPIKDLEELARYQNALLSILRKISIDKCDPQFKDDLKVVYALLSHTLMGKGLPVDYSNTEKMVEHNSDSY